MLKPFYFWVFSKIFLGLYRFLFWPLAFLVLQISEPFHFFLLSQKIKKSLSLRRQAILRLKNLEELKKTPSCFPNSAPWVWFHCSSGEVEYAKPLLRSLKAEGKVQILLTYFSPSILPLLKKEESQLAHMILPLPWDRPRPMQSLLKIFAPKAILIAHSDLWPEMLCQAQKAKVPVLYFSARFSAASCSFFKYAFLHFVLSFLSKSPCQVHCIDKKDKKELQKAFPFLNLQHGGNTRVDERLYQKEQKKTFPSSSLSLLSPLKERKEVVFIAGSTWPKDEAFFLFLARHFSKPFSSYKPVRWILVPHEPRKDRIKSLLHQCKEQNLKTCLYSQAKEWPKDEILLVDQVGILANIYQFGHIALVGGGWGSRSHSLLEPFAWGLPLLVGPHCQNQPEFRWMQNLSLPSVPVTGSPPKALNIVSSFSRGKDLFSDLLKIMGDLNQKERVQQAFQMACHEHGGGGALRRLWNG